MTDNYLMVNIALADLLNGAVAMPLFLAYMHPWAGMEAVRKNHGLCRLAIVSAPKARICLAKQACRFVALFTVTYVLSVFLSLDILCFLRCLKHIMLNVSLGKA